LAIVVAFKLTYTLICGGITGVSLLRFLQMRKMLKTKWKIGSREAYSLEFFLNPLVLIDVRGAYKLANRS